ncbi:unnamed protein product [Thelazia callipaeda]|uniref:UDP-N-acetylglucosamine transporter n=1 Tax=Thelazia callipaeda TaxID=103827 RepID=A0A0N5CWN5_THECL|nr:unnamed protein product [Thelazia callipaeda]
MVHHLDQHVVQLLSASSPVRYGRWERLVDAKNLKWLSLIVLILQTTALALLLRYSRTQQVDGPRYLSSTAVINAEILKLLSCLVFIAYQHNWHYKIIGSEIYSECWVKSREALKMAVPAFLYVVQNNLLFLALSTLNAATYQVTYQLKILTTAFFSITLLGRKLNILKWMSLLLLTGGVALVQFPKDSDKVTLSTKRFTYITSSDQIIGLLAVIVACFSSGFAGVYMEKILKVSPVSLWIRNLQLAYFSVLGGLFMVWLYDFEKVTKHGFFQGYNMITCIVVILQAYGGLLISLVVKYADNILKGFAVSLSITLSCFISYWFLNDFKPSLLVIFIFFFKFR